MSEKFQLVDGIWLAAESGYQYRTGESSEWKKLITLSSKVWFSTVYSLMQSYTNNVDGSVVEERESTLTWCHRNAEEEHGNMVIKELYNNIKAALGNCPVEIVQGKGSLEVKPMKLKKVSNI